jgi:peptide-methionine (S)-S-oxide reductase
MENQTASLGTGCFWCTEAILSRVDGIDKITPGYMGGHTEDPTYQDVCSGETGHAEIVKIQFDPARIGFEQILEWFWVMHDPTTLNAQGADVGTQYRSVIFYHDEAQREAAEQSKEAAGVSGRFSKPIVTEISAVSHFYPAEGYHQDYYRLNQSAPYCRAVIAPKLEKLDLDS